MAQFSVENTHITGLAACVPEKEFLIENYNWVSQKERNLFMKRIGVKSKRVVEPGTTTADLCCVAADRLLDELGWNRNNVDVLIFISQTGDYLIPGTSGILQHRLKLPTSCMSFDINLGCTAFVYGLSIIASMLESGRIKRGLLLMGETSSLASYRDKSAFPLMGDAGTAIAVEHNKKASPMSFNLQTDGSGYDAIMIRDGGARHPFSKKSLEYKKQDTGIIRANVHAMLNRNAVFQFCLREVVPNIKKLLEFTDLSVDSIDYFLFHQANLLINETLRKKLKIPEQKFPYSLNKFGNTSSASIPLTAVSEIREALQNKSLKLMAAGFGVGLSWGSVVTSTNKICCPELIEYST